MSNTTSAPELLSRSVDTIMPDAQSLATAMHERKLRVYMGMDATGSLLTLGHSIGLRKLQAFAEQGHDVIMLIGDATTRIGDPTGKNETRPVLTDTEIEENIATWKEQAGKILDFDRVTIRRNSEWWDEMSFVEIVQLMGKSTVQQLLERDMFQDRMAQGQPIHTHELFYPLMQGYDSVVMDIDLEIGGTDQLFNMMVGRTMQKAYNNKEKWVLATPLINGTDGRKMSKSFDNYIAIVENANDMYGKLMSTSDEMIIPYFTTLTDVPLSEIAEMEQAMAGGENPLNFKKELARTITRMYHPAADAEAAEQHFEKTVQGNELPEDMPTVRLASPTTIGELLQAGLPEESNSQLRRLLSQGAVEIIETGERPEDFTQELQLDESITVRVGKRRYFKVAKE